MGQTCCTEDESAFLVEKVAPKDTAASLCETVVPKDTAASITIGESPRSSARDLSTRAAPDEHRSPAEGAAASAKARLDGEVTKPDTPELLATCEFTVLLKKSDPSAKLGLGLTQGADNELVIDKVSGDAMLEWNDQNPGKIVRRSDEIIAVNGTSGDADTLIAAMQSAELRISLRRRLKVVADVTKIGPFGLRLDPDTLDVVDITDGLIKTWNAYASPKLEICAGDVLFEINGVKVNPDNAFVKLSQLQDGEQARLVFSRPPVLTDASDEVFLALAHDKHTAPDETLDVR